jgi:hypothetical protein
MKMRGVLHSAFRRAANIVRIAAGLSVGLMLLMLPVPGVHQRVDHFRSPEIRRSIERSVFLERSSNGTSDCLSTNYLEPTGFVRANAEDSVLPPKEYAFIPQIPLPRLLLRHNSGSSHSGIPDPLL